MDGAASPAGNSGLKHVWLRTRLRELIRTRGLLPGSSLPGERQLEEAYSVSRITVRRAIADLVSEGVLVRVHGKGTFVAFSTNRSSLSMSSLEHGFQDAGIGARVVVLKAELSTPSPEAVAQLGVTPDHATYLLVRLRLINDKPVSIEESWLLPDLLPDLLTYNLTGSLDELLTTGGHPVHGTEQAIQAEAASDWQSEQLSLSVGAPMLVVVQRKFGEQRKLTHWLSYSKIAFRSDMYRISCA